MNTKKKLKEINNYINKSSLPTEISKGIIIKHKIYDWERLVLQFDNARIVTAEAYKEKPLIYENRIVDFPLQNWEIIGKEIMLNDVIQALEPIEYFNLSMSNKKLAFEISYYYLFNDNGRMDTNVEDSVEYWDLSKPRLEDQSEDFINFIYYTLKRENLL